MNSQDSAETLDFTINGVDVNLNTLIANGDVTVVATGNGSVDANGDLVGDDGNVKDLNVTTLQFNTPIDTIALSFDETEFKNGVILEVIATDFGPEAPAPVGGDDVIEGGAGDDIIYGDGGNSHSAGGEGVLGDTLGDGPGSIGGGYDRVTASSVSNGNHSFSTDAFYLGNDIPVLDDANRDAITGVSFSQDGEGTDRTFGLDELTFTGGQRSFVGLVTVQDSDISGANDQFSSSISGGFQDTTVVSSGTADFTMNDGKVFEGIRVNYVRGPDGETYMMPDDGPSPGAQNAFKAMLFNNSSGIKSFTIATGSGDDAGINPIEGNWADGQFLENSDGDGGDDTIIGGEGADQMFGEGGDDTFIVSSAADGAGDVISGGNGPDENTDNDVLDLTGAGPVTINATADANDAGAQSGTVTFEDGSTLTFEGIETIIQDPDNTAPTANDDVTNTSEGAAVQVNVLANDTDPEGGDLDILGTPTAANGTISVDNETGEITYTPNPGFVGTDTITYTTVDEGGLTDTATLTVNVAATPDSGPDAIDDNITVFESEGAGDTDGNVLTNDLQEAGEPGPYTGGVVEVNGATGNVGEWIDLPEGGRVLINSDGSVDFDANGDFEELNDGESENVTIDYCIQTTSASSSGANPGEGPTINVGTTLTNLVTIGGTGAETFAVGGDGDLIGGTAISVTGNLLPPLFFGNDNDTLDISGAVAQGWTPTELIRLPDQPLIGNGFSGSVVLTKDGELPVTITYLEIENFVGFDNVTEKDDATLTITVQGENDAPVADNDSATTDFETQVTIDVLANDTDADNPQSDLTILGTPTVDPAQGTVAVVNGELVFTPAEGFAGDATITYVVSDGASTDSAQVVVTVGEDPTPIDGTVDGEETGEDMGLGYDDADGPTDGGGDIITNGDDVIEGNGGNDTIDGADGNDTIDGGADDDLITAGDGEDSIIGGTGSDTLVGGAGDDILEGGVGDDDIAVGGGDVAFGGTGDDVFTVDPTDTNPDVAVTIDGGADGTDNSPDGTENGDEGDVLDLSGLTDGVDIVFGADPEDGTVDGLDADGKPDITFEDIEKVVATDQDDTINGFIATTPLDVDAGDGQDDILGGTGDDTIDAGAGADTIDGGAGDDTINLGEDPANPGNLDGDVDTVVLGPDDSDDVVENFDAPTLDANGDPVGPNDLLDVSGPDGPNHR